MSRARVGRILSEAWNLLTPRVEGAARELLAGLIGQLGVPQLLDDASEHLVINHPDSAPKDVNTLNLANRADGTPVCLDDLMALAGTDEVVQVESAKDLERLLPIERLSIVVPQRRQSCPSRPNT